MSVQVEKILDEAFELGEGPHWDERQKALFFVNIKGCTIHKYVLASKKHTKTKVGKSIYTEKIVYAGSQILYIVYFFILKPQWYSGTASVCKRRL